MDELEFMLQAIKAVNDNLTRSLQESQEEHTPYTSEEQVQVSNWRDLLNTSPGLYVRLVRRLDIVISCGRTLPKPDVDDSLKASQGQPVSGLTRQQPRAENVSAPSRRSKERRSPSTSYRDEPAADLGFLYPDGLHEGSSNITRSYLAESYREIYSQSSSNPSGGIWMDEIAKGGRHVPDHVAPRPKVQHTALDVSDADDIVLGDGLGGDWIDALLEKEMTLQSDSVSQTAEDVDMDAAMTELMS